MTAAVPSARRGFTLIETLVVLAVLVTLFAVATPVTVGVIQSSRISSNGEALLGRLLEAQQMAIAQDTDVEVRLYQGTQHESGNAEYWCALQLFALRISSADNNSEGTFEPVGTLLRLDPTTTVSSDNKLSSLLTLKSVSDDTGSNSPGVGLSHHVAFRFHSDGTTDLTPGQSWFLTLVGLPVTYAGSNPANYYTIQIDPTTGRLRTYRP